MYLDERAECKLSLFKKVFMYETDYCGLVVDGKDGVVSVFCTNYRHDEIYCCILLGAEKNLRNMPIKIRERYGQLFIECMGTRAMIDYSKKKCATNDSDVSIYGSSSWGTNVQIPWNSYNDVFFE
ncbi:MAG: hypothetical protein E7675_00975 [Ruminococcaceae bacterium]|nr:hypothetical protein [Oscillospiraceae bacterium]